MRLEPKAFWDHIESLKQKEGGDEELSLWLAHGLPVYSNGETLLKEYEKSLEL